MTVLKSFITQRRGNVAVIVAMAMMPLLALTAAAIDFGIAQSRKIELVGAADGAVLAGINQAQFLKGRADDETIVEEARKAALSYFRANAERQGMSLDAKIDAAINNGVISVSIGYAAKWKTLFMGIFNLKNIEVANTVGAEGSMGRDVDMHLLVDASGSMGIGANREVLDIMDRSGQCAFACHVGGPAWDSYETVRQQGLPMRIDVARHALLQAVGEVKFLATSEDLVRFGLYRFHNWLDTDFEVTDGRSADFDWVMSMLEDRVEPAYQNGGGTDFHEALRSLQARMGSIYAGDTNKARSRYLFIVTDGIEDNYEMRLNYIIGHDANYIEAPPTAPAHLAKLQNMKGRLCQELKQMGFEIGVLYTPYVIPYVVRDAHRRQLFDYIETQLLRNTEKELSQCASKREYFYLANKPEEISAATSDFFGRALMNDTLVK